jgi:hypothetical protein
MSLFDTPDSLAALDEVGQSFEQLGSSLRKLAAVGHEQARKAEAPRADVPAETDVRRLWARLGPANREFLFDAAVAFEPGDSFTLDELAHELRTTKGSVRARLMNLGRSLKSLGPAAPDLWDVTWDEEGRENIYDWRYDAHVAIRRMGEG